MQPRRKSLQKLLGQKIPLSHRSGVEKPGCQGIRKPGIRLLLQEVQKPGIRLLQEEQKPGIRLLLQEVQKPGIRLLLQEVQKPGIRLLLQEVQKPGIRRLLPVVQRPGVLRLLRGRPSGSGNRFLNSEHQRISCFWCFLILETSRYLSQHVLQLYFVPSLLLVVFPCLALLQTNFFAAVAVFQFYMLLSEFSSFLSKPSS